MNYVNIDVLSLKNLPGELKMKRIQILFNPKWHYLYKCASVILIMLNWKNFNFF